MFKKLHTVPALIATATCALAVSGPLAVSASATPNTGRYQKTQAVKQLPVNRCENLHVSYQNLSDLAEDSFNQGLYAEAQSLDDAASSTLHNAGVAGCGWAL